MMTDKKLAINSSFGFCNGYPIEMEGVSNKEDADAHLFFFVGFRFLES